MERILPLTILIFNLAFIMSAPKVTIVGSGNWGSAAARRIALNVMDLNEIEGSQRYNSTVTMWVYEEEVRVSSDFQIRRTRNPFLYFSVIGMQVDGRKLTDIINNDHVNSKYLPGVPLPLNVVASSDIHEACSTADLIFFVVPHQFLGGNCQRPIIVI